MAYLSAHNTLLGYSRERRKQLTLLKDHAALHLGYSRSRLLGPWEIYEDWIMTNNALMFSREIKDSSATFMLYEVFDKY